MTKELAQLLDGPVAERFGRPTIGDGPKSYLKLSCGDWHWWDDEYLDDMFPGVAEPIAEALWLAHLLGVCGEWTTEVLICQHCAGCLVRVGYSESNAPTMLEALARAMLAVPEKP